MSRSYKKHPYCVSGTRKTTKEMKRYANKSVRNYNKTLSKGKSYKKLFCSYDIHEYRSYWTWYQAKKEYELNNGKWFTWQDKYPTLKLFYRFWNKYYRRK